MKRSVLRDVGLVFASLVVGSMISGVVPLSAIQDLQAVLDAYTRAWDTGKTEGLEAILADGFKRHQPGPENPILDKDGLMTAIATLHENWPDYDLQIDDQFVCGDRVASVYSWTGTNKSLGKKVRMTGVSVGRFQDGKILEERAVQNQADLLFQLGWQFVPPEGAQ